MESSESKSISLNIEIKFFIPFSGFILPTYSRRGLSNFGSELFLVHLSFNLEGVTKNDFLGSYNLSWHTITF